MTHPQAAPPQYGSPRRPAPTPAARPRRPGALTALLLSGVLAALAGVIGSALVLSGGEELAETNVKNVIEDHPDVLGLPAGMGAQDFQGFAGPLWDELISERADTLAARALLVVFFSVVLLVFTLLARTAAVWARVLITLVGLLTLIPHLLVVTDHEPASATAFSCLALVACLAAMVCCWLPANQRYANALRAAAY